MTDDFSDFSFYARFAKPMILNLSDAKDRVIAALWLKKLKDINEKNPNENLHIEYLKLLIYALQKCKLSGIFEKHPPEGSLQQYSNLRTAMDMVDLIKPTKIQNNVLPSIHTSIGGDLREYVAVQEIPNFGIHGYYAISNEPIQQWTPSKVELLRKKDRKDHDQLKSTFYNKSVDESHFENTIIEEKEFTNQLKSLQKEMRETRLRWSTDCYTEKFINETSCIPLPSVDAVLQFFKDGRVKPISKYATKNYCDLTTSRIQVEQMLNVPPCARIPMGEIVQDHEFEEDATFVGKR